MQRVYLDHNATTPMREEAREVLLELTAKLLGNPSSLHAGGRAARAYIAEARERVAQALGVAEDEVTFTSGATEANNLALFGSMEAIDPSPDPNGDRPGLLTIGTEHSSVFEPACALERRGYARHVAAVDRAGLPVLEDVQRLLETERVDVVSISAANGENGAVPDLAGLVRVVSDHGRKHIMFHTDAVQALGRVPLSLDGIDLASFSAHKLGGPPGVGVLWRRAGTPLVPRLFGGAQESELRPGTENAPAIYAAAVAIELAENERVRYAERTDEHTRFLWSELQLALPTARLIGPAFPSTPNDPLAGRRLPNTLCVSIPETDGRVLVTRLDLAGLEASAGSACASGSAEPSHVLQAMGYDDDDARSGLRLSLGRNTSREDCKRASSIMKKVFAPTDASRVTS